MSDLDALVESAERRLADSDSLAGVFAHLARESGEHLRTVAIAVCVAAGTSVSEAEGRLNEYGYEGLWELADPGDEEDVGFALEVHGYFDTRPTLDETGTKILDLLNQAFAAIDGIPAGGAVGLWRRLKAGRLAEAWLILEQFSTRQSPNTTMCLRALLEAATLLDPQPGSELDQKAQAIRDRPANLQSHTPEPPTRA